MPIYEYHCLDCGEKFELIRQIKDADSPVSCQVCESKHTNRLISVFFAQSAGRVIAGESKSACSSCIGKSCSTCGN